jgi:hypothetical protein
MKTISYALVTTGLLALTACGGGAKGNNGSANATALNSTAPVTGDLNSSSTLPPVDTSGANVTAPTATNGTAANTSATNGSAANLSTTNSNATNSTTK